MLPHLCILRAHQTSKDCQIQRMVLQLYKVDGVTSFECDLDRMVTTHSIVPFAVKQPLHIVLFFACAPSVYNTEEETLIFRANLYRLWKKAKRDLSTRLVMESDYESPSIFSLSILFFQNSIHISPFGRYLRQVRRSQDSLVSTSQRGPSPRRLQ